MRHRMGYIAGGIMKRDDLIEWENRIMEEVVKRRKLGGYSMEAEGLLLMGEAMLKILGHLIDHAPKDDKPPFSKK